MIELAAEIAIGRNSRTLAESGFLGHSRMDGAYLQIGTLG